MPPITTACSPTPRNAIRWGILSTGAIAHAFAEGLQSADGAITQAVASRNAETAHAFAEQFNIPNRHGSYEDLVNDPEVDVVYIGTPHNFHMEHTLLCIEAGKAVLCEKPFAINAAQARKMVETARKRNTFLMEAMWTRFFPLMTKLRELIDQEVIGDVRMITADFGFRTDWDPDSRLLNPEFGGGSLLDVGIYPISFAAMLFGHPDKIAALAHIGETGVDEQAGYILGYEQGQLAVLHSAVRTETPQEAAVIGTRGMIRIDSPFWRPSTMTLAVDGEPPQPIHVPYEGNGYNYQAEAVMEGLRESKMESPVMPLDDSIKIMKTLDQIRNQFPLKYPME